MFLTHRFIDWAAKKYPLWATCGLQAVNLTCLLQTLSPACCPAAFHCPWPALPNLQACPLPWHFTCQVCSSLAFPESGLFLSSLCREKLTAHAQGRSSALAQGKAPWRSRQCCP